MKNLKSTPASLHALGVKLNRELEQKLLEGTAKKEEGLKKRFWKKVKKESENECWNWIGGTRNGYGIFTINYRKMRSHRVSFIWARNKIIPEGMYICHTCDNPLCVNPNHLWIGSNKENQLDASNKGRSYRPMGELAPWCKLKSEQVLEIRKMYDDGICQRRIAENFCVGYKAINKIVLRHRWKHI